MRFANPYLLWLLLVFPPALLAFFWWSWRKRQKLLTQFIHARLLPGLISGVSPVRKKIRLCCLVLAVVCLILALARPQWGFDWQEIKQRGLDIVVAIDTSKSMLAEDIAPNRLRRAKLAALDLMQQAKSDRLGLVAFAGTAFLQCPLTVDDSAFRQSVESLDVNTIPQGGTAIADAIDTALTAFKEGENHKVLVLFTDGEDHDSGALEAAKKAAAEGMHIFTIGIGSAEGEILHITDAQGRTNYIRDGQGNVVKSHLDEKLLQEIAGAADGFYLPLRGANTIDTLYEKGLAPLPKSESQERLVRQYHEKYHWPLAAAIGLLLLEMLLPERKQKSQFAEAASRAALVGATAICLLLTLPSVTFAVSPGNALREYQAGQYDDALKDYQQLLQRKGDDPRLPFNAGAAAYRDQKFDEAAKQFGRVLSAPDLKLQALGYYNLGNTLYRLGEQKPDLDGKQKSWEDALNNYTNTLRLNPQDADAKFNCEFVSKRLEELKQQQQQQKNQQQNNQQQKQQDQQNQSNQQQSQDKQQSQSQQSQQQQQKQQAKNQSGQQNNPQKQEPQQAQSSAGKPDEKQGEQKEQAQTMAGHEMTQQEAERLLDSEKGSEQVLQMKPPGKPQNNRLPVKDW